MEYKNLLSEEMNKTLVKLGYEEPTPIQEKTLPILLEGNDLIGIAQTGTGKTAAFAIPIIEKIFLNNNRTQALILCPTRELAIQTADVFKKLTANKKIRIVSIYGGQPASVQIRALRAGAQIIVGTPGRVKDLINRNAIKLKNVRFSVLDEADEMLDFGFLPDIKSILGQITGKHQSMLFTATMSNKLADIGKQFLNEPKRVEAGKKNEPVKTVKQLCIKTEDKAKIHLINKLMSDSDPKLTLIFCNTRRRVKSVTKELNILGMKTACIHGDLSQRQRDSVMKTFRNGKNTILVATDVAARGIDVKDIDLVINYDVPDKPEYYVHRIGRTGRAGHEGLACTLVNSKDRINLMNIKRRYNVSMA